jgi:hypothetical protein
MKSRVPQDECSQLRATGDVPAQSWAIERVPVRIGRKMVNARKPQDLDIWPEVSSKISDRDFQAFWIGESEDGFRAALRDHATGFLAPIINARVQKLSRRSLARLWAYYLLCEDPQRRMDARPVASLRKEFDSFIGPIRKEFDTRRGEFRAFLRETVPSEIEKLVMEASLSAQAAISRYLDTLGDAHWSTLRAAVRRGGTFYGSRHIDLPNDFALRFEEPVAEIWGKKLLQLIRKRTKTYAEDCVALIEDVLNWAKEKGARTSAKLIEALHEQIKAASQQLNAVGKELINETREEVKNRLFGAIRLPIRRRCGSDKRASDSPAFHRRKPRSRRSNSRATLSTRRAGAHSEPAPDQAAHSSTSMGFSPRGS